MICADLNCSISDYLNLVYVPSIWTWAIDVLELSVFENVCLVSGRSTISAPDNKISLMIRIAILMQWFDKTCCFLCCFLSCLLGLRKAFCSTQRVQTSFYPNIKTFPPIMSKPTISSSSDDDGIVSQGMACNFVWRPQSR